MEDKVKVLRAALERTFEICTFRSEINAHEHDNAENLAAILTARLQKLR